MKPQDAEFLRQLVHARSGVAINPANTYQIASRLGPVARQLSTPSIDELIAGLRSQRNERAIWAVVEAMVSTESWFFRDMDAFKTLTEVLAPKLAKARSKPVRIWSAACAAGQEPYSIAMALAAAGPAAPKVDLYGSDLSEACIHKAEAGIYTPFEVQRGLPIRALLRHFRKEGEMWKVRADLAHAVRWRRINLLADLSPLGEMDVIFCRNVISLMDHGARLKVLENIRGVLAHDGYLVLDAQEAAVEAPGFQPVEERPGLFTLAPGLRAAAAA